ncbi:Uncharacterised protein [uncultured archaeon]|nr:Uncharacterised protein [uncultured archaeon]
MGFAQKARTTCLSLAVASMVTMSAGYYFLRQQQNRIEWEYDSYSKYRVPPIVLFADEKSFEKSGRVKRLPMAEKIMVLGNEEEAVERFGRENKVDSALVHVNARDCSGSKIPVSFRGYDIGTAEEREKLTAKMDSVFTLLESIPCSAKPGRSWFDIVSTSSGWITIDRDLGVLGMQDGAEINLNYSHVANDSLLAIAAIIVHENAHVFTDFQGMHKKASFWNRVYNGLASFCTSTTRLARPVAGAQADSVANALSKSLELNEQVTFSAVSSGIEKQAIFVEMQFLKDASAKLGSSALLEYEREEALLYSMRREEFSSIINDNMLYSSMLLGGTISMVLFGLSSGFFFLADELSKMFCLPKRKEQS